MRGGVDRWGRGGETGDLLNPRAGVGCKQLVGSCAVERGGDESAGSGVAEDVELLGGGVGGAERHGDAVAGEDGEEGYWVASAHVGELSGG